MSGATSVGRTSRRGGKGTFELQQRLQGFSDGDISSDDFKPDRLVKKPYEAEKLEKYSAMQNAVVIAKLCGLWGQEQ